MNFDVGSITEITKQVLGTFFGMLQINTTAGQGMMQIVDFFGMLGDYFVRSIQAIGSLFGGIFG